MVDPKRGLLFGEDIGDALHRCDGLLFIEVNGGHPAIVPIVLEVNGVTTQQDRTGFGETNQK